MKSLRLLYTPHSVINLLQKLLKIKEYDIVTIDENEGIINAVKKRRFKRDLLLTIRVSRMDDNITNVELTLNIEARPKDKEPLSVEDEEENLLKVVHNYF